MVGLSGKIPWNSMIWGYPYFRKPPYDDLWRMSHDEIENASSKVSGERFLKPQELGKRTCPKQGTLLFRWCGQFGGDDWRILVAVLTTNLRCETNRRLSAECRELLSASREADEMHQGNVQMMQKNLDEMRARCASCWRNLSWNSWNMLKYVEMSNADEWTLFIPVHCW